MKRLSSSELHLEETTSSHRDQATLHSYNNADMQSTRFLASNMLRQQALNPAARSRVANTFRMQPKRQLNLQASRPMRMPVPREEQSGHTVSQRLRKLKSIPPELIPLGVVLAAAIFAAGYSVINKLFSDKTLRLTRRGKEE